MGNSQLPNLMHVDKSASVWMITFCGVFTLNEMASFTMSDSLAPPEKFQGIYRSNQSIWKRLTVLTFRDKFSVGQKRHIVRMLWGECVSIGIDLIVHAHCILRCIRFSCGCRLCLRTVARVIFVGIRQQRVAIVSVAIELLMLLRLLQCIVMMLLLNRWLHHTDRSWLLIIHLTDARIFAVCVAAQFRFETVILYFGCGFAQAAIHFFGIHGWCAIVRFNRWLTRARTCFRELIHSSVVVR